MGKPHGYARLFDAHGNSVYEGRFINGRPAKQMSKAGLEELEMFKFGKKKRA